MKQFKGKIADKKLSDFNQYDNKLTKHKDRIEYVEGFLYEEGFVHSFFSTYFNNYYAVSPSQDGYLAEQDSVCKLLEILGTYILNANDVESNRKIEYRFWKSEKEYRDYKQSQQSSLVSTTDDGKEVEVIDMFVDKKNDKNQKIVRQVSVTKKDIKEIDEIRHLENAIDYLKSPNGMKSIKEHAEKLLEGGHGSDDEQERLKYIFKNTERYIDRYAKALRESQVLIKKSIKRPIEFKNILKDEGVANKLDAFDFYDEACIKKMLPMIGNEEDLMSDIGILVYDLNQLLDEVEFSSRELGIIDLFRKGYAQKELADILCINKRTVSDTVSRIAQKVAKTYVKKLYLITQKKA